MKPSPILWALLLCVPAKTGLLCKPVQDTSTGSLERLAEIVTNDHSSADITCRQTLDLLKDDMTILDSRLSHLEMKVNAKKQNKGDLP